VVPVKNECVLDRAKTAAEANLEFLRACTNGAFLSMIHFTQKQGSLEIQTVGAEGVIEKRAPRGSRVWKIQ
jgi:hypothetical protein